MKIKKGDTVLIISGKDRGRKGKVLQSLPKLNKIVVEGINIIKKHRRPRNEREKGQVVELAKPISISNVKLICSKCSKATRTGFKVVEDKKYRICKKCKQEI
ncbi:MAG: 50S ribosomal protein L24 [bacterium]